MSEPLLYPDEPAAFTVTNPEGTSPFLILCDHAGKQIPRRLGNLGLKESDIHRHIGWDIGALAVSTLLSQSLDATLVSQTYSRLVIDCNRTPGVESSIPLLSEDTLIPGNEGISAQQKEARCREIFTPYHDQIRQILEQRRQRGQTTCILAMHSFTPVYLGVARPWHIGVLYNRLKAYPHALLKSLHQRNQWVIGDNEPYSVSDATDYALPQHAEKNGIPAVEIELRQDLIAESEGQQRWAKDLDLLFREAWSNYPGEAN
ncbi:N-formylglutamate amidohydrolase [Tatumella sp. UBA2305]|uniref:N-formylglutamate amidohydrolase n=1 Tax=Tatumella sp. UBA2305 TaxID=1947647 RepID=UPI0025D29A12|nr:N-formylglutamate amidohydrolase [Tatumella sp. UBA2305]